MRLPRLRRLTATTALMLFACGAPGSGGGDDETSSGDDDTSVGTGGSSSAATTTAADSGTTGDATVIGLGPGPYAVGHASATLQLGEGRSATVEFWYPAADGATGEPDALLDFEAPGERHDALAPLVGRVAGRAETAPFPQPVGMIEAPAMAVFAFPIDGDLPALIEATEAGRMRGALRSLLPAIGLQVPEQSDCRAELVDYGRQRRCTLRYHLGDVTVYGKLTGDGSGAMAGDISAALIDVGQRGVSYPACAGLATRSPAFAARGHPR
jgi:hypothetical protein